MHFEVLVEDQSGSIVVDHALRAILGENGENHTWKMHGYRGLGRIPKDLRTRTDRTNRLLLEQLPRVLRGYGKSLQRESAVVVVVVDLDDRDCMAFKRDLLDVLEGCTPRPRTIVRIAIEEIEAWLLGDGKAVAAAYPGAKKSVLAKYSQDSICGTWELLGDAVVAGGSAQLKKAGWPAAGAAKCEWAEKISPLLDPRRNQSPSFQAFRDGVRRLAAGGRGSAAVLSGQRPPSATLPPT